MQGQPLFWPVKTPPWLVKFVRHTIPCGFSRDKPEIPIWFHEVQIHTAAGMTPRWAWWVRLLIAALAELWRSSAYLWRHHHSCCLARFAALVWQKPPCSAWHPHRRRNLLGNRSLRLTASCCRATRRISSVQRSTPHEQLSRRHCVRRLAFNVVVLASCWR